MIMVSHRFVHINIEFPFAHIIDTVNRDEQNQKAYITLIENNLLDDLYRKASKLTKKVCIRILLNNSYF